MKLSLWLYHYESFIMGSRRISVSKGKVMKERQYRGFTAREQERAQVRKNMRRWVKLREHFDKKPLNEKKSG